MHAYIHTYVRTHVHTCIHTDIRAYVRRYVCMTSKRKPTAHRLLRSAWHGAWGLLMAVAVGGASQESSLSQSSHDLVLLIWPMGGH